MSDYGMEDHVYDLNLQSAQLAAEAITEFENSEEPADTFYCRNSGSDKPYCFNVVDVNDPGARACHF